MEFGHDQYETQAETAIHSYGGVVLGSSYCTGYVDISGRWNTGFYCPETEDLSLSVFCCGNSLQKYCCTKAELRIPDKEERYNNTLSLILLSLFVIILAATTISFIFCTNIHTTLWRQKQKFLLKYRGKTSPEELSPSCDQIFPSSNSTQIIVEAAELEEDTNVPAYSILPLGPYVIVPQHTPDLICETQPQVDSSLPTRDCRARE